jgi:hypothetical protein
MNNKGDEILNEFKSKFLGSAEEMKNALGPSLCLAKWKQVSLHLATGLNNSCYHPPLHEIRIEDIGRGGTGYIILLIKKNNAK